MLKGDNKMSYILFGEKEVICDDTNIKEVLKELYALGYTVLDRGQLFGDARALEVRRQ